MNRREVLALVGSGSVAGCQSLLNSRNSKEPPTNQIETSLIKCEKNVNTYLIITADLKANGYSVVELEGSVVGKTKCENLDMVVFLPIESNNSGNVGELKIELHSRAPEEQCKKCKSKVDFIAKIYTEGRPTGVEVDYYRREQFVGRIGSKTL